MFSSAVFAASDLPKNLLRYNMGALPMTSDANGQWVSVAPESLDWNTPYAAVLGGDIGKTVDLSSTKMFIVDLGQVESIERFSLFSQSATGSLSVFSSPIFEAPDSANWSELGSLTLNAGQSSTLTSTPADARYLKFVFSGDSKGVIGSMGAFGPLTFNDVRPADVLQPENKQEIMYSMNYATPASDMTPLSSEPNQPTEALMALFDDDPATQLTISQPMKITVDMGANRQLESLHVSAGNGAPVSAQFANTLEELSAAKGVDAGNGSLTTIPEPVNTRYAVITFNPASGNTANINGLSMVGPVDPAALVFERLPQDDVGGTANSAAGPIRPLAPQNPRVISE